MIIQKLKKGINFLTLGIIQFEKEITQGTEKLQSGAVNLNRKITELRIRQLIVHEIDNIAQQKKYPDIDFQEITESIKYSYNDKKTEQEKEKENEKYRHIDAKNRIEFAELIADLKIKHQNLDWPTLEKKIIEAIRY